MGILWLIVFHYFQTHIHQLEKQIDHNQIYYKNQMVCQSIGGNDVNLLTITAQPRNLDDEFLEAFSKATVQYLLSRITSSRTFFNDVCPGFKTRKDPRTCMLRACWHNLQLLSLSLTILSCNQIKASHRKCYVLLLFQRAARTYS